MEKTEDCASMFPTVTAAVKATAAISFAAVQPLPLYAL